MINEAVILAGGKAQRMQTAIDEKIRNTPKPLLLVKGRPIIEHQIEALHAAGIKKIILVVNPSKEEMFREKLSNYDLIFCHQKEPLGTAHALYCAKEHVRGNLFLVTMGDDRIVHNFKDLVTINQPTICGYEVDDVRNFGYIKVVNGNFDSILEKSVSGRGLANTGVYVMPKGFFDVYGKLSPRPKNGEYYLTDAVNLLKQTGHKFKIFKLNFWFGINFPSDLLKANS